MCVCAVLQGDDRLIEYLALDIGNFTQTYEFLQRRRYPKYSLYYISYLQLRSVVLPFVFLAVFQFFITNFSELVLTIF